MWICILSPIHFSLSTSCDRWNVEPTVVTKGSEVDWRGHELKRRWAQLQFIDVVAANRDAIHEITRTKNTKSLPVRITLPSEAQVTKTPSQKSGVVSNTRVLGVGPLSLLDRFLSTLIEVRNDEQDRTEHDEGDDPVCAVKRRQVPDKHLERGH